MKRCCSKQCSFVAASARLARPSSSRVRIVQSIGNALTLLSARKAFRTRLEQISIVCERNFPRNTKGGLTTRLLLKNIRVRRRLVLFRRCVVVVAESCSSLFHLRVERCFRKGEFRVFRV